MAVLRLRRRERKMSEEVEIKYGLVTRAVIKLDPSCTNCEERAARLKDDYDALHGPIRRDSVEVKTASEQIVYVR